MNKKIIIVISILVILGIVLIVKVNSRKEKTINNEIKDVIEIDSEISKEVEDMKNNSTMYDENSTLQELKEEYKITGEDAIYEIKTENDGRKTINVKADINYKVAFCGMIKQSKPKFEELDSIYEQNIPNKSGIWIKTSDYKKILSYLNNSEYLNAKYKISEKGYLQISESNNQTQYDKQIEKLINGEKQYIINISSTYYMVDPVTGEIIDNPYNELDEYQTYDYCNDNDKTIIFISENENKKLSEDEIFNSIIDLLR